MELVAVEAETMQGPASAEVVSRGQQLRKSASRGQRSTRASRVTPSWASERMLIAAGRREYVHSIRQSGAERNDASWEGYIANCLVSVSHFLPQKRALPTAYSATFQGGLR